MVRSNGLIKCWKICLGHMSARSNLIGSLICLLSSLLTIVQMDVSTGFSPFMLMYGFQPRSPVLVGLANEKINKVKDFLQDHMDMLRVARLNVRQAQDRYKKFADQKRRPVHFKEGD